MPKAKLDKTLRASFFNSIVLPVMLYASETWVTTKKEERQLVTTQSHGKIHEENIVASAHPKRGNSGMTLNEGPEHGVTKAEVLQGRIRYKVHSICCILNIINIHIYTYTCRIHINAMNKDEQRILLKNIPLTLLERLRVRGSWKPNRTAIYWPPLLWPSALCLSRFPGLPNRRPGGPALCWMMAFSTASCL